MVHVGQGMLQGMGKRSVPDVVQQNGDTSAFRFLRGDIGSFLAQRFNGLLHQVQGAQCVMKARMQSARIHIGAEPELPDSAQSLEIRVVDQIEQDAVWDGHKAVDRVVEDFFTGDHLLVFSTYFCAKVSIMVQAQFTISSEDFNDEIFAKIKDFLKGRQASVTISIESTPAEAPQKETRQEYFTKLDRSIAELDRGEGVVFALEEFETFVKK